jgi:hypothetical protein
MLKRYKTGLGSYMDHQCSLSASGPTTRWRVHLHKAFHLCEYVFAFCPSRLPNPPFHTGARRIRSTVGPKDNPQPCLAKTA